MIDMSGSIRMVPSTLDQNLLPSAP